MKARLPQGMQMKQGDMMRQIQQMQQQMESVREEVEQSTFTAKAGGGMVEAEVNGKKELLKVTVDPQVVDPDDVEMLEDLIVAAVNEALHTADNTMNEKMEAVTGGMNLSIPGLM